MLHREKAGLKTGRPPNAAENHTVNQFVLNFFSPSSIISYVGNINYHIISISCFNIILLVFV